MFNVSKCCYFPFLCKNIQKSCNTVTTALVWGIVWSIASPGHHVVHKRDQVTDQRWYQTLARGYKTRMELNSWDQGTSKACLCRYRVSIAKRKRKWRMRKRRRRRKRRQCQRRWRGDIPSVSNSFTGPLRRQSIKLSLSKGNVEWVFWTELRKSDRRDLCRRMETGEWRMKNQKNRQLEKGSGKAGDMEKRTPLCTLNLIHYYLRKFFYVCKYQCYFWQYLRDIPK